MGRIDNIKCDDIIYEDIQLSSVAGMDDITCDDLNPECVRYWVGWTV